jgi:hypothetical protein
MQVYNKVQQSDLTEQIEIRMYGLWFISPNAGVKLFAL